MAARCAGGKTTILAAMLEVLCWQGTRSEEFTAVPTHQEKRDTPKTGSSNPRMRSVALARACTRAGESTSCPSANGLSPTRTALDAMLLDRHRLPSSGDARSTTQTSPAYWLAITSSSSTSAKLRWGGGAFASMHPSCVQRDQTTKLAKGPKGWCGGVQETLSSLLERRTWVLKRGE